MATKLNLHKLMASEEGYLERIAVLPDDRNELAQAREQIRDALREAFRHWDRHLTRVELLGSTLASTDAQPRLPVPRFLIQGSFAYHTVNDCQDPPQQQIDQDDGVFLPQSFAFDGGRARPMIAAQAYFKLVERALAPLCEANGWTLNPGEEPKNSCVRVELNHRLHIDLPLYAIMDTAFEQLVESVASARFAKSAEIRDSRELDLEIYRLLSTAEIILAHRKSGWIESDPRRLETWFDHAVKLHGQVVRELSRCFKGMRDARFDEGLTSISIMAAVVRAVERLNDVDPQRLDVALARTAREIARDLDRPIENPVFPGQADKFLCKDWDAEYRERVRRLFIDVADRMDAAIDRTFHKTLALGHATAAFGERVPNDETLISIGGASAAVRRTPADVQPKPTVPRTKSG